MNSLYVLLKCSRRTEAIHRFMIVTSMLSNWYSGATLLARLLNRHPLVMCNGETFPFRPGDTSKYDCSCGKLLESCDFYEYSASHMRVPSSGEWRRGLFAQIPQYSEFSLANGYLVSPRFDSAVRDFIIRCIPQLRRSDSDFVNAHITFMEMALSYSDTTTYLDGTKSLRRAQLFARDPAIELSILHLIRDPRGFCCSFLRNRGLPKEALSHAIDEWETYVLAVEAITRRNRRLPTIVIKYEDLCRETSNTIRKLCEFLEIPDFDVSQRSVKQSHILGNRMRRNPLDKISEDIRWRTVFDEGDLTRIHVALSNSSYRYGYNLAVGYTSRYLFRPLTHLRSPPSSGWTLVKKPEAAVRAREDAVKAREDALQADDASGRSEPPR